MSYSNYQFCELFLFLSNFSKYFCLSFQLFSYFTIIFWLYQYYSSCQSLRWWTLNIFFSFLISIFFFFIFYFGNLGLGFSVILWLYCHKLSQHMTWCHTLVTCHINAVTITVTQSHVTLEGHKRF